MFVLIFSMGFADNFNKKKKVISWTHQLKADVLISFVQSYDSQR